MCPAVRLYKQPDHACGLEHLFTITVLMDVKGKMP